jgi:hypothetical protein
MTPALAQRLLAMKGVNPSQYECVFSPTEVGEIIALMDENDRLRAALAHSKDPCVYCSLPAEEMAKCRAGFPGCARADDMMLCPNFYAAFELEMRDKGDNDPLGF